MRISIFLLFASMVSCTSHGQEMSSGFQKISTGALWYEYQHVESSSVTIVFESGAMSYSAYWEGVFDTVGKTWSAIRYDRAGLGSSPSSQSTLRSAEIIASELDELLDSLGIQNDIVLVCHSIGGYYGLTYANKHPEKINAIVLMETPCIDWEKRLRLSLTVEQNRTRDSVIQFNRSRMPDAIAAEYAAVEKNHEYLGQMFPLEVPIRVIYGSGHQWPEDYNHQLLDSNWQACQESLESLSHQVEFQIIPNSGHHLLPHLSLPDIISGIID